MIILAAGMGTRLRPLTDTRPKCLVELGGRAMLDWQVESARTAGVDEFVVVGGYRAEQLRRDRVTLVVNPDYDRTTMVHTLFCAESLFGAGFIMSYGDIVCSTEVIRALLDDASPIGVVVDRGWRRYWETRFDDPLSDAESLKLGPARQIIDIGQKESDIDAIEAQYIGLAAFRGPGVVALRQTYEHARAEQARGHPPFGQDRPLPRLHMTDLLRGMIVLGHTVTAVPISGGWVEVDSHRDLAIAERFLAEGRLGPHGR